MIAKGELTPIPADMLAEFEARHGKVRRRVTRGARPPRPPKPSAEQVFAEAWERECALSGAPPAQAQYRFHDERRWSFDYAWPAHKLALELEGFGTGGGGGRHHLPAGIIKDCEKFNAALLMGWRVLRVPSRGGRDVAQWVALVKAALEGRTS